MSVPRFFVPDADGSGSLVVLPEDEAAHLTRVLRLSVGDRIGVFDGRGGEWRALVEEIGKRGVTARLVDRVTPAPESRLEMTLAAAVLKGEKMDSVVRDAVTLGVQRIIPVVTQRTEISASAIERSRRVNRWHRIAVASAKQCGRAIVPAVLDASSLTHVLALTAPGVRIMLVEPAAGSARALRDLGPSREVTLLIGPEGGWTDAELEEGRAAGAVLTTIGGQILRADTVPTVALTALRVLWGDL